MSTAPGNSGGYRLPSEDVVRIMDAPPSPLVSLSRDGKTAILLFYHLHPPIDRLAEPMLGLAGVRFFPRIRQWRRTYDFVGFRVIRIEDGQEWDIEVPRGARMGTPSWSPDGRYLAYTCTTDEGVELWLADVDTGVSRRLREEVLNDILAAGFSWLPNGRELLVNLPAMQGSPKTRSVKSTGPRVEIACRNHAQNRTFQDLLKSERDEELFEFYFTSQLARVTVDGTMTQIGKPGIFLDMVSSPNGEFLLVEKVRRPYSHTVPIARFGHSVEVWRQDGTLASTVAELPVADAVPIEGVREGARAVGWQPLEPAALIWPEALDGGDPRRKVEARDRIVEQEDPVSGRPAEVARLSQRLHGHAWLDCPKKAFLTEWDRDRRWVTTRLHDFSGNGGDPTVIVDRSIDDRYRDPGSPVRRQDPQGNLVVRLQGNTIFLSGLGSTPEGDRPFLDRMDLDTLDTTRIFHSERDRYTSFVQFAGADEEDTTRFVVRRESRSEPPNLFLYSAEGREVRTLTSMDDPHPELTGVRKEVLAYSRSDGTALHGTLHTPPGYKEGDRLPTIIWAYPREFTEQDYAGQVTAQPNRFTRMSGASPLFFLTQGYAVLEGATMPVVGDPETANDTFVDQVVASAEAAIDALVERGVSDRDRIGIGGHSYGAFLVANLLAHTRLFRAGTVRSGAYNRTLTPFGFQHERRTLWEAPETYEKLSPFMFADRIKDPLLLIHGELDENPGTLTIQTERLFHALQGLEGTARMVILPHEGHGYAARESVLHVLAESFDWFDRYLKGDLPGVDGKSEATQNS